ncbi:hypothetical protein MY11210_004930 [Beauveria gryllotalpidicola]
MAVTTAISDLLHFVYESIASFFNGIYSIIHGILCTVTGLLSGLLRVVGDTASGVGSVINSITAFVAGNIVLIIVGAVLAFVLLRSTTTGRRAVQQARAKQ